MIRCLIVEDEILAQQVIQSHLQHIPQLELAGVCSNAAEAKNTMDRTDVDLIFLDIQLPGMTGLNFFAITFSIPVGDPYHRIRGICTRKL